MNSTKIKDLKVPKFQMVIICELFKKMKILLTKKYLNKLNKKYQFHQKYHQAAVVVVVIAALVQVLAVAVLAVVVVVEVEKVILSFTYNI